jgi:hypothetical protein
MVVALQREARLSQWRNLLIVGETAMTVVLLIGAGLMVHSLWQLSAGSGFRPWSGNGEVDSPAADTLTARRAGQTGRRYSRTSCSRG